MIFRSLTRRLAGSRASFRNSIYCGVGVPGDRHNAWKECGERLLSGEPTIRINHFGLVGWIERDRFLLEYAARCSGRASGVRTVVPIIEFRPIRCFCRNQNISSC